jgi:hypothetical protein
MQPPQTLDYASLIKHPYLARIMDLAIAASRQ